MTHLPFAAGHLASGGGFELPLRKHAACAVCRQPFSGHAMQQMCSACAVSPEGKQWRADRQRAQKTASALKLKKERKEA